MLAACSRAVTTAPEPVSPATRVHADSGVRDADIEYVRSRHLVVPVAGVAPSKIADSYLEARGEHGGRRHNAVDILAPRGTPVLAADDGRVLHLRSNAAGGITVYATDPEARLVYYYAHLERYRDRLAEGMRLTKGDTIGYVGTTGNAPPDTPHLHFQVMLMRPDGKYWAGPTLDPLPFLTGTAR